MNRRAAEERLRLEGVATPDITSAARYATLPKMGTRDAFRAGQRSLPTLHAWARGWWYTTRKCERPRRRASLGENGGDAVCAPRRVAPRHCRYRRSPSLLFLLLPPLHLLLVRALLEIPTERPASPNLDINAGCRPSLQLLALHPPRLALGDDLSSDFEQYLDCAQKKNAVLRN